MACLSPRVAFLDERSSPARVIFSPNLTQSFMWHERLPDGVRSVALPCGKCFACRRSRALDLTVRAIAESRMYPFSSFVTLTVSDDFLSAVFPHGLCCRPFQLFAKRLRKRIGKFRYLMCGEYGSRTDRPHYHAVIYGHYFLDGNVHCPSTVLYDAWQYGHVQVAPITPERIAYVAGYTLKDDARQRDMSWYDCHSLGRPFVRWSRRPGLGFSWWQKYRDNMLDDDDCFTFSLNGRTFKFNSRYFLKQFQLHCPEDYDRIRASRLESLRDLDDTTCIMRHDELKRSCDVKKYKLKQKAYLSQI